MAVKAMAPAPCQLDPTLLPANERWTTTCPCGTETQGGSEGFLAHMLTCHPAKQT